MEREYLLKQRLHAILDLSGEGIRLTNAQNGVLFDMNADGFRERIPWTAHGANWNGWLVLDRNGNGYIDNGAELFGNFTPQPESADRNGFAALAVFDLPEDGGNGDGLIDAADAVFSRLRIWADANHNGISEPGELTDLPSNGITSISLDYRTSERKDKCGNAFRYRAKVCGVGLGRWAYDVFFGSVQ